MTNVPGRPPRPLSALSAVGIGCLVAAVLAALAAVVAVALVVHWWNAPTPTEGTDADVAALWPQPPEIASWTPGAGVIVDVNDRSMTSRHVPDRGVYLVTPESGQYAHWTGASAACSDDDHCREWAAARDRVFFTRGAAALFSVDPGGVAAEIDLAAMRAPPVDPVQPIAASWDGRLLAYTYRSPDEPEGTVVLDLEHRKVLRPALDHMSRNGWMALSPDGSTLAYETPSGLAFVGMAKDAVPSAVLGPWHSNMSHLAWAPDGAHLLAIVESRSGENGRDLWIIDAHTREATQVPFPPTVVEPHLTPYDHDLHQRAISASFAPDGRSLVILSDVDAQCGHPKVPTQCECDAKLYRADLDGSGWRKMSDKLQACGVVFWVR